MKKTPSRLLAVICLILILSTQILARPETDTLENSQSHQPHINQSYPKKNKWIISDRLLITWRIIVSRLY
jgi:hypothetical protein